MKISLRRLVPWYLLFVTVVSGCHATVTFRSSLGHSLSSVGFYSDGMSYNSCFAVGPHTLVSAGHGPSSLDSVPTLGGLELTVVRTLHSGDRDLRLIEVEEALPYLPLGVAPNRLDDVYMIGSPFGPTNLNTIVKGMVSNPSLDIYSHTGMLQLDVSVAPGFSGGPVLNTRGEVVGVVVHMMRTANVAYAEPVHHLKSLLKEFESAEAGQ